MHRGLDKDLTVVIFAVLAVFHQMNFKTTSKMQCIVLLQPSYTLFLNQS